MAMSRALRHDCATAARCSSCRGHGRRPRLPSASPSPGWTGLGHGHGYLAGRELTVTVTSRRTPVPRRGRVLLPAIDGALVSTRPPQPVAYVPLEAVG